VTAATLPLAVFGAVGLVAIVSGLAVITRRNPVAAVAWLVVHFVATACLYVLLHSQFLAAVQVLVYAGAIMVLFLFVIMLLSVDRDPEPRPSSGAGRKAIVAALLVLLVAVLARAAAGPSAGGGPAAGLVAPEEEDSVEWLAEALFSRHVVAFEVASVLLVAGMAGVLVYTTRRVRVGRPGGAAP
jgi:NADH-quinone oxidoreductase subunit J